MSEHSYFVVSNIVLPKCMGILHTIACQDLQINPWSHAYKILNFDKTPFKALEKHVNSESQYARRLEYHIKCILASRRDKQ